VVGTRRISISLTDPQAVLVLLALANYDAANRSEQNVKERIIDAIQEARSK